MMPYQMLTQQERPSHDLECANVQLAVRLRELAVFAGRTTTRVRSGLLSRRPAAAAAAAGQG